MSLIRDDDILEDFWLSDTISYHNISRSHEDPHVLYCLVALNHGGDKSCVLAIILPRSLRNMKLIRHPILGIQIAVSDILSNRGWHSGPRLNIKTVLSMYGDFHVKDKTAVRPRGSPLPVSFGRPESWRRWIRYLSYNFVEKPTKCENDTIPNLATSSFGLRHIIEYWNSSLSLWMDILGDVSKSQTNQPKTCVCAAFYTVKTNWYSGDRHS